MRECRSYGSVRGAPSNGRPYRDPLFFSCPNDSGSDSGPSGIDAGLTVYSVAAQTSGQGTSAGVAPSNRPLATAGGQVRVENQRVGNTTVGNLEKTMTNEDGSLSGGPPGDLEKGKTALANAILNNAGLARPAKVAPDTGTASSQDARIMSAAYLGRAAGNPDPVEGRTQFGNSTHPITSRSALNGLRGAAGRETVYARYGPFSNSIGPPTYTSPLKD
jgi:hypothetical protein